MASRSPSQRPKHRWLPGLAFGFLVVLGLTAVAKPAVPSLPAKQPPPAKQGLPAARDVRVSPREIADKIAGAYGGMDRLRDLKNLPCRSHGTHSVVSAVSGASNALICDILSHGEKLRLETKMIGQTMILGYNGKGSWTQFGDWVSPSTETTVKRISEEMQHGLSLLADVSDSNRKLEYDGKKQVCGKTCDILKVYADDGKPTTFYADENSHLVLRSEFLGVDHEQGVPAVQAVDYLDYRPVAGTQCPYRSIEYTAGKRTSETNLDKMEIGVAIDDKVFDMPPESEVERVKEGPVTVPFDFTANQIIVKVRINSQDYNFIVDTGASQSVVDKAIAPTIGSVSQADFSITAGSKAVPLSYMTIPGLTLGDVTLNKVPALITDLSSFSAAVGQKPAGLLGANVLRRFLVTLDFYDHKIVLADPHKVTIPDKAIVLKTSPVYGATALVVSGKLDDQLDLNFLVDTGAGFSNLPQAAVKPLLTGPVLPVGQIFGVDGRKLSIGSIRLKSLKLGNLELPNPVFALAPEGAQAAGASGLFTAGAMGILGNPIWSQFLTTIDYRNERLILEQIPGKENFMKLNARLAQIELDYRTSKNADQAIASCENITRQAHSKNDYGGEALGLSALAGYYLQKGLAQHDMTLQSLAGREYARAEALARQSGSKEITARVLSQWAGYYIQTGSGPTSLLTVQSLIQQALKASPTEASAYACLGNILLDSNKTELAGKLLDQALMLDPANWSALWAEYRFYRDRGNADLEQKVVAQLKKYYPGSPDIASLSKSKASNIPKSAPRAAQPAAGRQTAKHRI